MYKRIKITKVVQNILNNGAWNGWIVACNVSDFHIEGGWRLGYPLDITSIKISENIKYSPYIYTEQQIYVPDKEYERIVNSISLNRTTIRKYLDYVRRDYEIYNCCYELGYYANFVERIEDNGHN